MKRKQRLKTLLKQYYFLLLALSFPLFSFNAPPAQVSLKLNQATVEYALKKLKAETKLGLIYKPEDVRSLPRISVDLQAVSVEKACREILKGTSLTFSLEEDVIVIRRAAQAAPVPVAEPEPKVRVQGTVRDKDGESLIGVSIHSADPRVGAVTDIDGNYVLNDLALDDRLTFSYVGFRPVTVSVSGRTQINVVMEPSTKELDEMIVVGYTTRKKSSLTGSLKALDGEVLANKPVASFDQALQGQVAGVFVMATGVPGGGSKTMIRGVPTANADGTQPLYILDGIPITPVNFASLNPNDIEQYTVLKDAAATSIYGSLAANGVILLTSKRGRDMERSEVSYRFQLGTSSLAKQNFKMMNTEQRLRYEEELGMRTLDETGAFYIIKDDAGNIISRESKRDLLNINTNWVDEIFRNGTVESHELSLRGGNKNTKYYTSLGYFSQEGILPHSGFDRLSLRVNMDHQVTNALKVGLSSTLGKSKRSEILSGNNGQGYNTMNPIFASYALLPYMKPYNDDGQLIDFSNGLFRNPLLYYSMADMNSKQIKSVVSMYAELQLHEKLKFKTVVGVDYQDGNTYSYVSPKWDTSETDTKGFVSRGYIEEQNVTNTNLLTYKTQFDKVHDLTVLLGEELLTSNEKGFNSTVSGLANDKIPTLSAGKVADMPTDYETEWATLSFFSQASYNYKSKYYLDLSLRRDGSSRFGKNKKWANFWSVGMSWHVNREENLEISDKISLLNVTASTGTSGNSNLGSYEMYETYNFDGSYNGQTGSVPHTPGNQNLTWETVWKNNLGVDILFVDKYRFKLEGYYNKTSDILFYDSKSLTSGFVSGRKNIGQMSNYGLELEWDLNLYANKDIFWKFNGNFTYSISKMGKMNGDYDPGSYLLREGERYGLFYLVRYAGVDPLKGTPLWYTADGQLTDTYNESDRYLSNKSIMPSLMGGFGSQFTCKGFGASIFFSWMADKYMLNQSRYFYNSNGMMKEYNQGVEMLDYWKQPGDVTSVPHPSALSNQADTRYLENASFLRLKDISLFYELDKEYLSRLKVIKSARLSLQAQNLYTWTGYQGFDPEHMAAIESNVYPQAKAFTFGIDLTF